MQFTGRIQNVVAQFSAAGETISGTSYFYCEDHLGLTAAETRPFAQFGHTNPNGRNLCGSSRSILPSPGAKVNAFKQSEV
jgi:hypothetical protein